MRDGPCDPPRSWPGSNCSISSTSTPLRLSHQAAADPMAPAPTMATRTSAGEGGPRRRHALAGAVPEAVCAGIEQFAPGLDHGTEGGERERGADRDAADPERS